MSTLPQLLGQVADVYDELVDASLPGRTGQPRESSPDPRDKPAPGNLSVIEHRHLLLRGLRWWADAVRDPDDTRRVVASDVRWLCRWLYDHLDAMAPEDRAELARNLSEWLERAWPYLGDPGTPMPLDLPPGAWEQRVRVADAAKVLGCTVRTIRRRVPIERRQGGMVRLGDAVADRCPRCDLPVGQCEHTRAL